MRADNFDHKKACIFAVASAFKPRAEWPSPAIYALTESDSAQEAHGAELYNRLLWHAMGDHGLTVIRRRFEAEQLLTTTPT